MTSQQITDYLVNAELPRLTKIYFITGKAILCSFYLKDQDGDLITKNQWIVKPIEDKDANVYIDGSDIDKLEAFKIQLS